MLRRIGARPEPRSRLALNTLQMRVAYPIRRGLVSYWPLQLGGAVDEHGIHDGVVTGATKATGKYGDALHFGANTDRVTISDHAELKITGDITITAWVYHHDDADDFILSKSFLKEFEFYLASPIGRWRWYRDNTLREPVIATPVDTWFHAAIVDDGTNAKFYKDGGLVASPVSLAGVVSVNDVNIGNRPGANGAQTDGKLDEVCLYNRALSAGEIFTDMNRKRYS